jgi:hypothetical protein
LLDDGTARIDNRKICTVLKSLAHVFAVDISMARTKYSHLAARKISVPIPLHHDLVLIPVKLRKPLAKEDGAFGYVVLSKIKSYKKHQEYENTTQIFFKNGHVNALLFTKSFQSLLEGARIIANDFRQLHLPVDINYKELSQNLNEDLLKYYILSQIREPIKITSP